MFSANLASELVRRRIPGKIDIGVVPTGFLPMVNEMSAAAAKAADAYKRGEASQGPAPGEQ